MPNARKGIEMFVAAFSMERSGWCVFKEIDDLTMRFHAGPFSEAAAAESEARRLNGIEGRQRVSVGSTESHPS